MLRLLFAHGASRYCTDGGGSLLSLAEIPLEFPGTFMSEEVALIKFLRVDRWLGILRRHAFLLGRSRCALLNFYVEVSLRPHNSGAASARQHFGGLASGAGL